MVGKRADHYLKKWQATEHGGFNVAAFLLSGLWLPYRKMYRITAILYSAIIVESLLEELVFVWGLGWPETPRAVERGVSAAVCWLCGGFGNRWYLAHVKRVVADARAEIPDDTARLTMLAARGGTSVWGALGFFALFVVGMMVMFILLELIAGARTR